ncbi:serine hydrolase domain-containing protein [Streptomyces sp. NPDC048172]|uniref:serine hydrolase domain-containing protein n=1 Tax=Streptomyces sp. NPDC048172 TaxID=3365505 RepID=UPI0037193979
MDTTPVQRRRIPARTRVIATCCVLAAAVTGTLAAGPAPASSSRPDDRHDRHDQLQRAVERAREDAGFVGLSVEVRDGERRDWAGAGEAKLGTGKPVPRNGSLRAASATKSFTAVVVLQLVAEGKLSLDDPVEKWLPGVVSGNGNDGNRVTVRHLLQHTSGIYNYDFLEDTEHGGGKDGDTKKAFERTRFNRVTPEDGVTGAMRHKPDFPPAAPDDPEPDWNYSNPNFLLAGMLIEKITGHPWDREVRHRITHPLALRHTYAPAPGDASLPEPHARTYQTYRDAKGWTDTTVRTVGHAGAAGSLISTERDLERFYTALIRGRLLPPRQLAEMRRTVPVNESFQKIFPGMGYGLGLMRNNLSCGGRYVGHGGDLEGFYLWSGVTEDGHRSLVINATGKSHDPKKDFKARRALNKLTDEVLCR